MTGKKIISLFSGAGGMDIGFKNAGFEVAVAVEQDSACCETLRANNPNLSIIEGDICAVTSNEILAAANLQPTEAALVIGGPPCQSFSLAGKRMGMSDPRGMLLIEFVRVVRETLPKVFVLENVKGMLNWAGGKAMEAINEEFTQEFFHEGNSYNYKVSYQVLKASDFGVPQHRERVFVVGNRLEKVFKFPEPTFFDPSRNDRDLFNNASRPYKTVWDAIGDLPQASEPSEMAQRISKTIKERIVKHGY